MQIELKTKDDLIDFIESHELTTKQVNELLAQTKTMGLFIYDHTPMERAQYLRESFNSFEPRIFLDLKDIGVVQSSSE
jgi:hypothetical protein